ncbi:unnamed protein product [Kuraishia capsulata CBS 1993]|uniref:Uncharacterized protein n=1 Tax=Kuraishia capsulata CBS 1993 TaxID=1382522 RepID=W6MUY4_9ASCO|nr:uncharacterized protein KUCA_T00005635001 [Kuraishia capsulata CBS 1993]CDK29642.1 unnamed protein product [Kuraishia capsulata CBS 1993]
MALTLAIEAEPKEPVTWMVPLMASQLENSSRSD